MRWNEITGDIWTISAERAKNGLAHRVPLSPQAIVLLDTAKEISGKSEYIFPSPKTGHIAPSAVGKALRRHLKELKEPITRECAKWFTPHTCHQDDRSGHKPLGGTQGSEPYRKRRDSRQQPKPWAFHSQGLATCYAARLKNSPLIRW